MDIIHSSVLKSYIMIPKNEDEQEKLRLDIRNYMSNIEDESKERIFAKLTFQLHEKGQVIIPCKMYKFIYEVEE